MFKPKDKQDKLGGTKDKLERDEGQDILEEKDYKRLKNDMNFLSFRCRLHVTEYIG